MKTTNLWKLIGSLLMSAAILCSGVTPVLAEEETFDDFLEWEWKELMESDYMSMHFSVEDWAAMGLSKPEVSLGEINYEAYADAEESLRESLDTLHTFDYDSLDARQKHDYLVYEDYLESAIELNQFPNYEEMFNPYNGLLDNLQTTFTEFVFYQRDDIDDYLVLVDELPFFLDQMVEFTKAQASQGYFMDDETLEEGLEQMDGFINAGEDNPFIVIFNNNIDAFEGLTDDERVYYKDLNRELVLNHVLPAYQSARDTVASLKGSRMVSGSLYDYPDGPQFYEALLHDKTSSSQTPQEVFDYLNKAMQESYQYLIAVIITGDLQNNEPGVITELTTPVEALEYLRTHMEGFPAGPDVTYTPSYLDPSVANPGILAYYLTTPIDNLYDNVIRINGETINEDDLTTLYYTLAHEGFPGHLYQFTWYQNTNPNPLRHDISVIGYQEGWAQYVEKIMLDRSELSWYDAEYYAMDTFLGYTLNAAADVAVNGLGYDIEQLEQWLDSAGFNSEIAPDLYQGVIGMPGMILPYGYGIAKFWEYRERVETALGDQFDEEEFHLQLLTNGPRPFEVVEADLEAYVASKGAELPSDFTFFAGITPSGYRSEALKALWQQYKGVFIIAALVFIGLIALIIFFIVRAVKKHKRRKQEQLAQQHISDHVSDTAIEQLEQLEGTSHPESEDNNQEN
ncbi:MAG: DUF885 family protein [Solobacterium sp.]|nr:DUF885 family protein [Solobacterium sp.]